MNPIKFYRVDALPESGEVGGLYFLHGEANNLYVCVGVNTFEKYGSVPLTNEEINQIVLNTTSSEAAFLSSFDNTVSDELNDIIYGTDTTDS